MPLANVRLVKDINHQSLINFQFSSEALLPCPSIFHIFAALARAPHASWPSRWPSCGILVGFNARPDLRQHLPGHRENAGRAAESDRERRLGGNAGEAGVVQS